MHPVHMMLAPGEREDFVAATRRCMEFKVVAWARPRLQYLAQLEMPKPPGQGIYDAPVEPPQAVQQVWHLDEKGKLAIYAAAKQCGVSVSRWIRFRLLPMARWETVNGSGLPPQFVAASEPAKEVQRGDMLIRFSLEEKLGIRNAAEVASKSMSAWARDLILGAVVKIVELPQLEIPEGARWCWIGQTKVEMLEGESVAECGVRVRTK